jgi:hypothetical protein
MRSSMAITKHSVIFVCVYFMHTRYIWNIALQWKLKKAAIDNYSNYVHLLQVTNNSLHLSNIVLRRCAILRTRSNREKTVAKPGVHKPGSIVAATEYK